MNPCINPDGIEVYIPFKEWKPGLSVFVPALNVSKLKQQIKDAFKDRGWKPLMVECIEGGRLGVRIWRVL